MGIVLGGYARSGKDTVADILVQRQGYKRIAFADALKNVLYATNPIIAPDGTRLQEAISMYGPEGIKSSRYGVEYRNLLQRMGTEGGRTHIRDTVWVDVVVETIKNDPASRYVVTDARFKNEVDAIKSLGAVGIWIERPGVGPANGHASENQLSKDDFKVVINNHGTIEDLAGMIPDLN